MTDEVTRRSERQYDGVFLSSENEGTCGTDSPARPIQRSHARHRKGAQLVCAQALTAGL